MDIQFYSGIIAGIISLAAYGIYFYSMFRGRTRPNRITWLLWTFMGGVLWLSYYFSGARDTIWSPAAEFFGPLVTFLLALKYGEGGLESKIDIFCFVGGFVSIAVWILFNAPVVTLVMNLVIYVFALIPTIKKSYLRPEGESFLSWTITGLGNFVNLLSAEKFTFAIIIYPLWQLFNDAIIIYLLSMRKSKAHKQN